MLKSQIFTATAVLIAANLISLPSQAQSRMNGAALNGRLQQAVCSQRWGEAVKVVDQMIAATPASNSLQRGQLIVYRGRLDSMAKSRATIPNWSAQCSATSAADGQAAAGTPTPSPQ